MRFSGAMDKGEARLQLLFSCNASDKPKGLGLGEQREWNGAALGSLPVFLLSTFPNHVSMVQGSMENCAIYKRTTIEFLVHNMFTNVVYLISKKEMELNRTL